MDKRYIFSIKTNNCSYKIVNDLKYIPDYTEHQHNNIKYYGCALDSDYLGWRYDTSKLEKLGNKIVSVSDFIEIELKYLDEANEPTEPTKLIKLNDQEFKITSWENLGDVSVSKFFNEYYIQIFIFDENTSNVDIVKCIHQHLINFTEFNPEYVDDFEILKKYPTAIEHYEKFKNILKISNDIDWNQYIVFDTKNQIVCNK